MVSNMNEQSFFTKLKSHSFILVIILVLIMAILPHAYNMFHYPYYEADEGTYMSQAWATLTQGRLAPYTYWYDHAPIGWITIGMWSTLTAGFNTFGFSINSGRVFMLVMHVMSSLLILGITKKIFNSYWPGVIAVALFSFSPLGIYFQRRVLLDNIMVFWLLVSLYLILGERRKLWHYVASALAISVAFLSKESAVYFIPGMMLLVFLNSRKYHNKFPMILWTLLTVLIVSYYPLYALLKGEFFQTGQLFGGTAPHVSLLETAKYQASRPGGFFLNPGSDFMGRINGWTNTGIIYSDAPLIYGGIIATAFIVLLSIFQPRLRPISVFALCYWYFLARGGIVIEFYVIPLIPLLALCVGCSIYIIATWISKRLTVSSFRPVLALSIGALAFIPFVNGYVSRTKVYTQDNTTDQVKAVDWIIQNVPKQSVVLIDMYAYIEMKRNINLSHYYWKADRDPEITDGVLKDNWCTVDYLLVTPQLLYDARQAGLTITKTAYDHSDVLMTYPSEGWRIEVRKVNKTGCQTQTASLPNTP